MSHFGRVARPYSTFSTTFHSKNTLRKVNSEKHSPVKKSRFFEGRIKISNGKDGSIIPHETSRNTISVGKSHDFAPC